MLSLNSCMTCFGLFYFCLIAIQAVGYICIMALTLYTWDLIGWRLTKASYSDTIYLLRIHPLLYNPSFSFLSDCMYDIGAG